MTTAFSKHQVSPAAINPAGGQVRVFRNILVHKKPTLSEKTRRTFQAISDPKNAHLFTVDAALKAFAHIKI